MKINNLLQSFALPLLYLFLPLCAESHAATTITAEGALIDGDTEGGFGYYSFNQQSGTEFVVQGGGSGQVEYPWDQGTMTLEGEMKARTALINGGWTQQAYARATLTNPHHFTASDHEVVTVDDKPYIPYIFGSSASSQIVTDLQYGSTAVGYTSRVVFRASGTVSNDNIFNNSYAYIGFQIYNASLPSSYIFDTNFDEYIATEPAPVGDGHTIEIRTIANIQFRTNDLVEGDTYDGIWSGEADFYHTLEVVGIDVRDPGGNLVTDMEIRNADGSLIPIVDAAVFVPEPSSAMLLAVACAAFSRRRLRRQNR